MKKSILRAILVAVLLFSITGCGTEIETEKKRDVSSMFICVEQTATWKIVYHKETKVMYSVSDSSYNYGVFTLLVDENGDPMIWEK